MSPLEPRLESGVLILDGGLATELERRGAALTDRLWSARLLLDHPALIREVHADYFRAGADVATTASYQASLDGFAGRGLDRRAALSLIARSVTLAREARDIFWHSPERTPERSWPLVAGSVGPYGAALADGSEYRGRYTIGAGQLRAFHLPRLEVLLESGADLLALETQPSLSEAGVLLDLLTRWPAARAWVSFTCRDEAHLAEGQAIEDAARLASESSQVVAVGVNCVAPAMVDELLRRLRDATSLPLVAYPNSGEEWDAAGRSWIGAGGWMDPAGDARRWYAAGARLVGGCCRTTPDTIREIRKALCESHASG